MLQNTELCAERWMSMYSNLHYVPTQLFWPQARRAAVELRYVMSHLSVSADNPGGRQRSGQDLFAGSVRPGQVHPRVLHCHRWHWFHSESTLPVLYEPSSSSTLNVICIHFSLFPCIHLCSVPPSCCVVDFRVEKDMTEVQISLALSLSAVREV